MTKLAFFDFDQTLYDGVSTKDFYEMLSGFGWGDPDIMEKDAAFRNRYFAGELNYDQISEEVIKLGIGQLAGKTREDVLAMEDEFVKISLKLYDYTRPLLRLLQRQGFICYLVSAATFPPVEAIGRELHMPFMASTGKMRGLTYTGELGKFMNGEEKRKAVNGVVERAAQPTLSLAFGDSTGDLPLLEAADQAFVINAHQEDMIAEASKRHFTLVDSITVLEKVALVLENDGSIIRG